MASTVQQEVDERTNLTGSNKFELLLFRLGTPLTSSISELFGINVFKVREIVAMPVITPVVGAPQHTLGVVNLRGQIMPVLDLPSIVGFKPVSGLNIMLVTEYAGSFSPGTSPGNADLNLSVMTKLPASSLKS